MKYNILHRFLFLALLAAVALVSAARAATYYIDFAGGNDSAAGTSTATAWKTIPGTRTASNSGWQTTNYGGGTIKQYGPLVQPGTVFKLKSGTSHTSSNGGRIWFCSDFYANGTSGSPITFQRDLTWGSGQVVIDGAGMTLPAWSGLVKVDAIKYIYFNCATANGIKVQNSAYWGVLVQDYGVNGFRADNLEVYNSVSANIYCTVPNSSSFNTATQSRLGGIVLNNPECHVTNTNDDTAANIYLCYCDGAIVTGALCYNSNLGSDGIHLGGCTNVFIDNCVVHDNGEQGIDVSRDGDHKSRDDTTGITIRHCTGYNNYKQNFDSNSGSHDVYWIHCTGFKTTITQTGDGVFDVYQGAMGSNYWVNCTAVLGQDLGWYFTWDGTLSTVQGAIPAGTYNQYLINCLTYNNTGKSVRVEADYSGLAYALTYKNCNFYPAASTVVQQKSTNFTSANINSGTGGWTGTACKTADPQFVTAGATYGASDLHLASSSPCVNAGIFPFTASGAGSATTSLVVSPVVTGFDVRRVFRPGDTLQIGANASAVVASVTDATHVTLTQAASWSSGDGVWFPWEGTSLQIGDLGPVSSAPAPPQALRVVGP